MTRIVSAEIIAPEVKRFTISAPHIARRCEPGQFVILRTHSRGERIPITIAGSDREKGLIELIIQGVGKTTKQVNLLEAGDDLHDLVGPLGRPTPIKRWGHAVVVSGGVGTAEALPIALAMKQAGNKVTAIIGARSADLLIAVDLMRMRCDDVIVTTDDGSAGFAGMVTAPLGSLLSSDDPPDHVLAVGPLPMMAAVSELTRPYAIPTMVSLNTIMVDGTGMCGGCRASVDGENVFVCVDGPEFDGHKVDYEELANRQKLYRHQERKSLEIFLAGLEPERTDVLV